MTAFSSSNYNGENQATTVSGVLWERLPADLLGKVMQSLNSADCIRLSAVCKSWRWVIQQKEFLSPKLPWLPLPYSSGSELEFYDLSDDVVHTVRVPKTLERACCRGSAKGWLLMANDTPLFDPDIFLFNPISGSRVRLPSMKTIPSFQLDDYLNPMWDLFDITQLIKKIEISSPCSVNNDNDSSSTIVAALIDSNLEGSVLAFCALGDDEWTVFKGLILNEISHGDWCYGDWCYDMLFSNGIFHVLVDPKIVSIKNGSMETNTIRVGVLHDIILKLIPRHDLSLQHHTYRGEEDEFILELLSASEGTYLVDCESELLIVYKVTKRTYFPYVGDDGNEVEVEGDHERVQTCQCVAVDRFEVFKIDQKSNHDNSITLTKLDSLGDNMIFVATAGSMSIPTGDLNGWKKKNCIFFLDDLPCYQRYYDTTIYRVSGMFSMEDKRIHRFLSRVENSIYCGLCWYSPSI